MQKFEESIGGMENSDNVSDDQWRKGLEIFVECCHQEFGKRIADLIKLGTDAVLLRDEASQALDMKKQGGVKDAVEVFNAVLLAGVRSRQYKSSQAATSIQASLRSLLVRPAWKKHMAVLDMSPYFQVTRLSAQ